MTADGKEKGRGLKEIQVLTNLLLKEKEWRLPVTVAFRDARRKVVLRGLGVGSRAN